MTLVGVGAVLAGREALARRREANLSGEVALITGGSRGLGFLLAQELAREGCRVAICARDTEELERARRELAGDGTDVLAVPCDVSHEDEVTRLVAAVEQHFGRVDILVANAGVIQVGALEMQTVADFEQAMNVMYWGVVHPTLAVLPAMRARRHGRIVTISSIGGKVAVPHLLPYTGAKFAAAGFSEGLAAELTGTGVQVTTIVPGLMRNGSYLNAEFKGRGAGEFTWFSLGATLPGVSMDGERAAHQIVRAIKRGARERTIGVPATLLARLNGAAPGPVSAALGLVNRFVLPKADGSDTGLRRGMEIEEQHPSQVRDTLTALGRSAARRANQYRGGRE